MFYFLFHSVQKLFRRWSIYHYRTTISLSLKYQHHSDKNLSNRKKSRKHCTYFLHNLKMTDIEMTESPAEKPLTDEPEEPTTEEPTIDIDPYSDGWHGEGWCQYYSYKSLYVVNGIFSLGSTNGVFSILSLNAFFCILALNCSFSILSLVRGKIMANWKNFFFLPVRYPVPVPYKGVVSIFFVDSMKISYLKSIFSSSIFT